MSIAKEGPKIIVIIGPTASGKSSLAIKLALRLSSRQAKKLYGINGAEIVSADSRQVYKGMDIGTAKPGKKEIAAIPHHLIDIKNPDEDYTVADYKRDALHVIRDILRRNKLPILVGGTGLYIKTVVENLKIPPVTADAELRQKLEKLAEKRGLNFLFQKLLKLDPEATYIVDPKNPRRVIRALEIAIKTGKPFSAQRNKGRRLFNALQIGIKMAPEKLKENISRRADEMMTAGLIREVGGLIKKYGAKQKALRRGSVQALRRGSVQAFDAIGYRELIPCIEGKKSVEEAVAEIKRSTWQYARRQMTWFKKDKTIEWVKNEKQAATLVKKFLVKT